MTKKSPLTLLTGFACALAFCLTLGALPAEAFDWKKHNGATITFISANHPWANAVLRYQDEFTKLTGINLKVDSFQEQQARQRMLTILQSKSPDMDVFMSLKSRDGMLYSKAGWYADLTDFSVNSVAPDFNMDDFGKGALEGERFNGRLYGIPLNVEGPVIFYRKDVFAELGIVAPKTLEELEAACTVIKQKKPEMYPWATRGLKSAVPYTFSNFLHNMGGFYVKDGRANLTDPISRRAFEFYSHMLQEYGPPGSVNNTFYQTTALFRDGRVAMNFESSNELNSAMEGGARLKDTGVMLLPPAANGVSRPTVIGWGISVSAFSKKQEAAWYFIMWATSPEMQERLINDGICPPRLSALQSQTFKDWQAVSPVRAEWANAIIEMSATGTSDVLGPGVVNQPEGRDIIGQAVNEIMLGQKSVNDATANANKLLQALLDKQNR